ncbi:MAG: hypothetical protein P1U61_05115 [Legionellaceae bacterium]|nr:hypothetical protein [Legionellaceae bacterium]
MFDSHNQDIEHGRRTSTGSHRASSNLYNSLTRPSPSNTHSAEEQVQLSTLGRRRNDTEGEEQPWGERMKHAGNV